MLAAVFILTAVCIFLIGKILVLKKAASEIKNQTGEILRGDTNRQITLSSADKTMRLLASELNAQLALLRKKQLRYENGDKELQQAITNISHDLKTPLTAILGYVEMAKEEENTEKLRGYLSIIESRSQKMKSLTDELFSYSMLNAPEKELDMRKTDIRSVLEDSIAENYILLTEKKILPEIEIPDIPVMKEADPAALQRVFSNILSNAAKYSDGDLMITMKENGEILFANTAEKLSAIEVGRLFDRFFTVEDGRNSTGLGLSIAKCLTEKMGGRIRAEYENKRITISLSF